MVYCDSSSDRLTATPSIAPVPSHPPSLNRSIRLLETSDTSIPDLILPPSASDQAAAQTLPYPPEMNDSNNVAETFNTNMPKNK